MPPPPVEPQPAQIAQLNAKLAELPALLRGDGCANAWGWGLGLGLGCPRRLAGASRRRASTACIGEG